MAGSALGAGVFMFAYAPYKEPQGFFRADFDSTDSIRFDVEVYRFDAISMREEYIPISIRFRFINIYRYI